MVSIPTTPAIVRGRVRHTRQQPIRHKLSFGTHMWLVDLAEPLPDHLLASFPTADHFGGAASSIREAAIAFATSRQAVCAPDDRVLMLAAARSFGYSFNPLSVFWCVTRSGEVRWVILEIHNTYGSRHAHLVVPDERGGFEIPKEFYVSPFFTVDGSYRVRAKVAQNAVSVGLQLRQDDAVMFSASFAGTPKPATTWQLLLAAARTPFVAHQTTARIKFHGIWLWLRRLPVIPRPSPSTQTGMQ
jgi:DUF1365 family protein